MTACATSFSHLQPTSPSHPIASVALNHASTNLRPHVGYTRDDIFITSRESYYLAPATMAEKRKLPPRDRRSSAVKRRISEAASPAASTPARKKSAPAQPPPAPSEPSEIALPTKIKDGQPLPTLPKPQPFGLPAQDYQSYIERWVVYLL